MPPIARIVLLVVLVSGLRAQEETIPIKFRSQYRADPDRNEGIREGVPAGGERIELISMIVPSPVPSKPESQQMSLGFSMDQPEDVRVAVREPEDNYWMEPIDETGNAIIHANKGFNKFSWDAVQYRHRTAKDLLALAQPAKSEGMVVPVLLWDSSSYLPGKLQVSQYVIAFLPNAEAEFQYEIRTASGRLLKRDKLIDLPKNVVIRIPFEAPSDKDSTCELTGTAGFVSENRQFFEQKVHFTFAHKAVINSD